MPRLGSPTASGRIQSRLCMPQQLKGADSSVLKIENRLWQVDLDWIFGRISSKDMGDTYFGHTLLWCSVPRVPRTMSRKARTVCHDEGCRLHCRWQSVLLNPSLALNPASDRFTILHNQKQICAPMSLIPSTKCLLCHFMQLNSLTRKTTTSRRAHITTHALII